ncbi:unnamed protein product [Adineta steineri]|uniref:ATPase AAA-type core domain-containing protein n=1 Tax=Adineta steineri TaxID=433720 RepID=A0A813MIX4_9BILA|nr:unnamed protein product [Adineta steineri]CAF4160046.1 unnamed protein product [Adineta steineri]
MGSKLKSLVSVGEVPSLVQYKEFHSNGNQVPELNLAKRITVLVVPNSCGKTTILQAVYLFCHAVRRGSGEYSFKEMTTLFWAKNALSYGRLSGTFEVFYKDILETKELKLDVRFFQNRTSHEDKNHNEHKPYSYVFVEAPNVKQQNTPPHIYLKSCLSKSDYGIFESLFPSVKAYDTKSMLTGKLDDIFNQYPSLDENLLEINSEMKKVFPQFELGRDSSKENDDNRDDEQPEKKKLIKTTSKSTFFIRLTSRNYLFSDISDCSDGFLRYLTLLIAILCQPLHSIITFDEPDAHIFPTAQKLLVEFFYRKMEEFLQSNHFCQILFTTHSPDIMQVVRLEDIRQLFPIYDTYRHITIKSLASTGQLLNVMTDVVTSVLSHGELVRLGVHRKLVYLESLDDLNFLHGIIRRTESDLLRLPYTSIAKGGRPTSFQIEQLIVLFRKFLPDKVKLHIFLLVDADLRSEDILEEEKKSYINLQENENLNVRIHYHCWAAREWENWLLSNGDLLYEMLFSDHLSDAEEIKQLQDIMKRVWSTDLVFPTNRDQFNEWFEKKLDHHFKLLKLELSLSQMGYVKTPD